MRSLVAHRFRQLRLWVGVLGWIGVASRTQLIIAHHSSEANPNIIWLYDWHVYAAGGFDLLDRTLYMTPLTFPGWPLPVATYNLPPFSAVWPLPLLWLPDAVGGVAWIVIGAVAWSWAWWAALRLVGIQSAWAWAGAALATYSLSLYWFSANIVLGNANHLVLALIVAFVWAYVRNRHQLSGVLLGLAIATKLWPVVLVVPLLRDRQWTSIAWSLCTAAIATALPLAWLGVDAVGPMAEALRLRVPIEPGVAVLWTTAFRLLWDWWPAWGSVAIAVALLAVPLRGIPGFGLAIIAGVSVVPNIWDHYLPTIMVGLLFAATAVRKQWLAPHLSRRSGLAGRFAE